jgi:hypothetical protein
MFDLSVSIGPRGVAAFARAATRREAQRTFRRADRIGNQFALNVEDIVRRDFITNRPPHRRKTGELRLVNSFGYRVTGGPDDFPITVELDLRPGANERKIAALNFGWAPFETEGGVFPGGKRVRPAETYTTRTGKTRRRRARIYQGKAARLYPNSKQRNAFGPNDTMPQGPMMDPGFRGKHFMQRAKRRTLADVRAGRV